MNYTQGLERLKRVLQGSNNAQDFLILEARLRENLHADQLYGSTEQIRASRAQIIEQLNRLSLRHQSLSFNDLCSSTFSLPSPAPRKIEPRSGRSSASSPDVFIGYSQKDKKYLDELNTHLAYFTHNNTAKSWDDTMIPPGSKWFDETMKALEAAKMAVLLVSADFLRSELIIKYELPYLLKASEQKGVKLLCVIVRPCLFQYTELAPFQTVNPIERPLSGLNRSEREEVWLKVVEHIRNV